MSNDIYVSIIVPVYNVEKYLPRCLDSLINQTLSDIEIICVNDASPDNSQQILEEYQKKFSDKIKLIVLNKNRCLGGARNAGIKIAQGEYIAFVDSDDFVMPNMFEMLYSQAKKTNADIVYSDFYHFQDGNYIEKKCNYIIDSNLDLKKNFVLASASAWAKIFRKDLFIKNEIYFPEHKFFEDIMVIPLLFVLAEVVSKVNQHLYVYCYNPKSITKEKGNYRFFDRLDTCINGLELFKKHNLFIPFQKELEYRFFYFYYFCTMTGAIKKIKPVPYSKLREIKKTMRSIFPNFNKNIYVNKFLATSRRMKVYTYSMNIDPIIFHVIFTLDEEINRFLRNIKCFLRYLTFSLSLIRK